MEDKGYFRQSFSNVGGAYIIRLQLRVPGQAGILQAYIFSHTRKNETEQDAKPCRMVIRFGRKYRVLQIQPYFPPVVLSMYLPFVSSRGMACRAPTSGKKEQQAVAFSLQSA